MSINTLPDGSLKISEHFWLARFGLFAFTVLVMAGIGYAWLGGVEIFHPAYGWLLGAAVTFGLAALLEDIDIEFNLPERRVRWQRRRIFSKNGGDVAMDAVKDITLSIVSVDGTSQYRLVMVTDKGTIPLSNMHTTDKSKLEQMADTIFTVLQRAPSGDIVDRSLNDAIAQGRIVEAVHWLRLRDNLSMTQARKAIDEMKRKESG